MIDIQEPAQYQALRRLALNSQGLWQEASSHKGKRGALDVINHLGYVQIDSISVIERAHHHVMFSRVPSYQPDMIDALLKDGAIFEYWSHAAAFLPIHDFRFSLPYKYAIKSGQTHWHKQKDKKLMNALLQRIKTEGPLRARDIEDTKRKKRTGWWDWKPAKIALEQLFMEGDLMVCKREGFEKTYDLSERVLPSDINMQAPSIDEFAAHLLKQQLRCHGAVSLKGISYLRKNAALRKSIKALVHEKLAQGELEALNLSNADTYFIKAGALDETPIKRKHKLHILSPFDNSVIQRERLLHLFNFHYQIECYVPAAKRRFGYFSLPLLYQDCFVGRMDCKAHRKDAVLELKSVHFEENTFEQDVLLSAWVEAVKHFARFQGCAEVLLHHSVPALLRNGFKRFA